MQTEKTPIGSFQNGYVGSIGMIPHSDLISGTDPYGKPAYKVMHRDGTSKWRRICGNIWILSWLSWTKSCMKCTAYNPAQGKSTVTETISHRLSLLRYSHVMKWQ